MPNATGVYIDVYKPAFYAPANPTPTLDALGSIHRKRES